MKRSSIVKGSVAIIAVIGAAAVFSGCSSNGPKMLEQRDYIPAPATQPGQPAVQPETPALEPIKIDQSKSGVTVADTTSSLAKPAIKGEKGGPIVSGKHTSGGPILSSSATGSATKYTVQKGDSLWKIAKKYGVSMKELAAANKIDTNAHLKVGKTLIIPAHGKATVAYSEKSSKDTAKKASTSTHKQTTTTTEKVTSTTTAKASASKETKPAAAQANAAPAADAKAAAPAATAPAADAKAAAPAATAPAADASKAASTTAQPAAQSNFLPHTVKEGDSWETISDMYGVSVADLKKANASIANEAQLKAGTIVNIPEE